MSCTFDREKLTALLDGELRPEEQGGAQQHLALCAECRAELEDLRQVAGSVRALRRIPVPPSILPTVRQQIRSAPAGVTLFSVFRQHAPLLASAAAILMVMIFVGRFERSDSTEKSGDRLAVRSAPEPGTEREESARKENQLEDGAPAPNVEPPELRRQRGRSLEQKQEEALEHAAESPAPSGSDRPASAALALEAPGSAGATSRVYRVSPEDAAVARSMILSFLQEVRPSSDKRDVEKKEQDRGDVEFLCSLSQANDLTQRLLKNGIKVVLMPELGDAKKLEVKPPTEALAQGRASGEFGGASATPSVPDNSDQLKDEVEGAPNTLKSKGKPASGSGEGGIPQVHVVFHFESTEVPEADPAKSAEEGK